MLELGKIRRGTPLIFMTVMYPGLDLHFFFLILYTKMFE